MTRKSTLERRARAATSEREAEVQSAEPRPSGLRRFEHPDEADPMEFSIAVAGARLLQSRQRFPEHNDFVERLMSASGGLLVWNEYLLGQLSTELDESAQRSWRGTLFDEEDSESSCPSGVPARPLWEALLLDGDADRMAPAFFRKLNANRHLRRELAQSTLAWASRRTLPVMPELDNAEHAATAFHLGDAGRKIVELSILAEMSSAFDDALQQLEFGKHHELVEYLARFCGCDTREMARLLAVDGAPSRLGLLTIETSGGSLSSLLSTADGPFSRALVSPHATIESFLESFLLPSSSSRLGREDVAHLDELSALAIPLLRNAASTAEQGVNLMLYGRPGTGKTEMARLLAEEAGLRLYEVRFADAAGRSLSAKDRLASLLQTLQALRGRSDAAVLLDEAEDVIASCAPSPWGRSEARELSKAWITRLLESNDVPVIWTSNQVRQMDPAILRRFSLKYQFGDLPQTVRHSMARRFLGDFGLDSLQLLSVGELQQLSPAELETAARAVSLSAPGDAITAWGRLRLQINHARRAVGLDSIACSPMSSLPYDATCLNVSGDLAPEALLEGLRQRGRAALCLHGFPGTGKTEFARHVARQLGRELIARSGSDLLSMWVGQTEERIAGMFASAADRADEVVLLLDEADTFLVDRARAKASWERSQTNEFLARMESFPGIFICTTNLYDQLDPAIRRRFQFRLEFRGLTHAQSVRLFVAAFGREPSCAESQALMRMEGRVVPADFANVARQLAFAPADAISSSMIDRLKEECQARGVGVDSPRPFGFARV